MNKKSVFLSVSFLLASVPFIGVGIDCRKMVITYKYEER